MKKSMRQALGFTALAALPLGAAFSHSTVARGAGQASPPATVTSPDRRIVVALEVADGAPRYRVERDGRALILPSRLGFELRGAPPLGEGLAVRSVETASHDETWTQPWGEVARIRNHYNEMRVELEELTGSAPRRFGVVFRVFDDGVGFRYDLPEQEGLKDFLIMAERTEFHLAGNHKAWWIPANRPDRYELLYRSSPVSTLDTVHTPLTMKAAGGLHLVLHEAALSDYASMMLVGTGTSRLTVDLAPWADGVKVRGRTPFVTPWRTLQVADRAADLITSYLVLNLNEPSRIEDTSWIRPMKYVGIWWEMHLGTATWGSGPLHGATTENARRYIDFAARNGIGGVLVEGWNQGWDGDWRANAEHFSFTKPYPDFDLEGVATYAREKGVQLIGHNETSMGIANYEAQLEDAFSLYRSLGITAVKTGYVGDRTREGHAHHGQYMVRHWQKVVETAARYGITLDVHEPVKDTGIRRTWPNMMTREGARGQEFNAWGVDGGNPPEHEAILPFTRMLAAPMDFTPGIFALETGRADFNRVNTTLAKQLALYVVYYSPLQMAADLPGSLEGQPAFEFIREVPVDWEETVALNGVIGDYLTVARRDRNSEDWYLGAVTDEDGRELEVPLDFLDSNRTYVADIWADGPGANWAFAPYDLEIGKERVDSRTVLRLRLAPGGGQAIRIHPMLE